MPDITDPIIVRFANERGRVAADALEQAYNTAKRLAEETTRLAEEFEALDDETDFLTRDDQIADGSESSRGDQADGRKPITGIELNQLLEISQALVAWLDDIPPFGEESRIASIRAVSVNGQARF